MPLRVGDEVIVPEAEPEIARERGAIDADVLRALEVIELDAVQAARLDDVERVVRRRDGARRLRVVGDARDDGPVRVASPSQTLRQYRQTRRTFDRLIWLVALLTGAAAVFGISNLLSASVIARTREIGVRRAVGARTRDIVLQFQLEGVLLGVLGGGAGLVLGVVITPPVVLILVVAAPSLAACESDAPPSASGGRKQAMIAARLKPPGTTARARISSEIPRHLARWGAPFRAEGRW